MSLEFKLWEMRTEEEMVSWFLDQIPLIDKNLVFFPKDILSDSPPALDLSSIRDRYEAYGGWEWNSTYRVWWIKGVLPSWKDFAPELYTIICLPDSDALAALAQAISRSLDKIIVKVGYIPQLAILPDADKLSVRPVYPFCQQDLHCPSGDRVVLPYISIPRERFFFRSELAEFEQLINSNPIEYDIQRFFEGHSHFLKVLGYQEVRSHLVLRKSDSSLLIPDFIARSIDRPFWDIIDLKRPIRNVLVDDRGSLAFSVSVYRGINQLKEYAEFFADEAQSRWFEAEHGIKVLRPELILIVGAPDPKLLPSLQILRSRHADVKIITYSELLSICKRYVIY